MTPEEMIELERLRAFKKEHEASALNRAFQRLEHMMDAPYQCKADSVMSVNAFRVLATAIIELKKEVIK